MIILNADTAFLLGGGRYAPLQFQERYREKESKRDHIEREQNSL